MRQIKKSNSYEELKKEELQKTEGGLGALSIILAVGGISSLAYGYKGLCDEIDSIGRNIGKMLAN
jgi:lactobin A/cerein 7B family class IIb bacteriocin